VLAYPQFSTSLVGKLILSPFNPKEVLFAPGKKDLALPTDKIVLIFTPVIYVLSTTEL